jgi:hypothetical protein
VKGEDVDHALFIRVSGALARLLRALGALKAKATAQPVSGSAPASAPGRDRPPPEPQCLVVAIYGSDPVIIVLANGSRDEADAIFRRN